MNRSPVEVTVLPAGVRVIARVGDTVLDAASEHGVHIPHECGGNCACTTCHVFVEQGADRLSPMEEPEDERLSTAAGRIERSRLACQAILRGGAVTVRIVGCVNEWRDERLGRGR